MTLHFTFTLLLLLVMSFPSVHSEMTFTSTPSEVKPPVTKSLDMVCAVNDDSNESVTSIVTSPTPTVASGIVGRAAPETDFDVTDEAPNRSPSSSSSSASANDPILHVASMTISRDGLPVATVSTYTHAHVESAADRGNLQVTGDVTGVSGGGDLDLGHLHLTWDFPTSGQLGKYTCTATAITTSGHVVTLEKSVTLMTSSVDIDDILSELRDLKKSDTEQDAVNAAQKKDIDILNRTVAQLNISNAALTRSVAQLQNLYTTEIDSLKTQLLAVQAANTAYKADIEILNTTVAQLNTSNAQLATSVAQLQTANTASQTQIDTLENDVKEAKHTETGFLVCGNAADWTHAAGNESDYQYHGYDYYWYQKHVNATFQTDYATPPVVFLAVSHVYLGPNSDRLYYGSQLLEVSSRGFSIRCGSRDVQLLGMEVSWLAVAA